MLSNKYEDAGLLGELLDEWIENYDKRRIFYAVAGPQGVYECENWNDLYHHMAMGNIQSFCRTFYPGMRNDWINTARLAVQSW